MKNDTVRLAIEAAGAGQLSFCKFLAANDTGQTGGHQSGIYIAKDASRILFDEPGVRGSNKDRRVTIRWQGGLFSTESRFIYYGTGTRNEYRITTFGRGFPYLRPERTGDLFVLVKVYDSEYKAFIFDDEESIDSFLDGMGIGPTDTGQVIQLDDQNLGFSLEREFSDFVADLNADFPSSLEMSQAARDIAARLAPAQETNPDHQLVKWIDIEYSLFRKLEFLRYGEMITEGFQSVEEFIGVANSVLNRRKSRAGRSLEHHLAAMFDTQGLRYSPQPVTEGPKRPDFLLPGEVEYHRASFPAEHLVFLGAKTTCKDRWRQILNEANRIPHKHLFTLQQGISSQQLKEMEAESVTLVVPEPYHSSYPSEWRGKIWSLSTFIEFAKGLQSS